LVLLDSHFPDVIFFIHQWFTLDICGCCRPGFGWHFFGGILLFWCLSYIKIDIDYVFASPLLSWTLFSAGFNSAYPIRTHHHSKQSDSTTHSHVFLIPSPILLSRTCLTIPASEILLAFATRTVAGVIPFSGIYDYINNNN
jgi:hypothetical protein